jgi:predicted DNA-binding ribbon-helix-helix protein
LEWVALPITNGMPRVSTISGCSTTGLRARPIYMPYAVCIRILSVKQPITLRNGKLTTISLEPEFFRALRLIAYSRSLSAADLIRNIEAQPRPWKQTFTSTRRCFVVGDDGCV